MSVGGALARVRRFRGVSVEDISNRTEISLETLSAIEDNRVDDIPTEEVRDVLRAYATEIQLDPEDVIERYLAELAVAPRVDVLPESQSSIDVFPSEATIAPAIKPTDITQPGDVADATNVHAPLASDDIGIGRIGVSPSLIEPVEYAGRNGHRYRATALVACIAAAAGFLLAEYSHRWRPGSPTPDVASIQRDATRASNPPQNAATGPRNKTDADARAVGPGAAGQAPEASRVQEPSSRATRKAVVPGEPNVTAKRAETRAASPTQNRAPAIRDGRPSSSENPAESPVQNLSGWWSVTNRVESTAYPRYESLNLGYRVKLTQKGDQISGSGRKWMENGRPLPPAQRTAIAVSGTVEQRRVMLSFTEYGTRRTSVGSFAYDISDTGVLQGSFTSDVAQSKGSSRAARMQTRE